MKESTVAPGPRMLGATGRHATARPRFAKFRVEYQQNGKLPPAHQIRQVPVPQLRKSCAGSMAPHAGAAILVLMPTIALALTPDAPSVVTAVGRRCAALENAAANAARAPLQRHTRHTGLHTCMRAAGGPQRPPAVAQPLIRPPLSPLPGCHCSAATASRPFASPGWTARTRCRPPRIGPP